VKKKLLFTVLIIITFVGSFLFANHFENKNIDLPYQVAQSMKWLESLFLDDPVLELRTTESLENKTATPELSVKYSSGVEQNYSHVEVGSRHACVDTSLGELKYKKVGNIYTWTDGNDVYHVSDKPPEEGQFELLNYADDKVFDYFSLNLNTESLPYDFNQKLNVKLNKLFTLYGKLLDKSSLKKVDINLRVYQSKTAFQQVKKQYNMPSGNNANGFYSHRNNQAHLLFTTNERTMRTAAHEATHAINRAIIGYSPRWLNEGLAEYSEYIQVVGQSTTVYPNEDWTNNNVILEPLLPLATLISANRDQWDSDLRQQLYTTSWAFVYFMMGHPQRKLMLAKLIKIEQQNLCNIIDRDKIEQQLEVPLHVLQKQFLSWSKLTLSRQSI
jgi:hypothetical protein